ncbi:MAG: EAL domain-containing protein [Alphaproteobacteria bacterium]|nr:EAL domain-containing protein [Alphaproteobacteria bacterium]
MILLSLGMLPTADASTEFWLDLNQILTACRDRNGGTVYDLNETDRSILINMNEYKEVVITTDLRVDMLRLLQRNFPDYFGLVDQARLLRVVPLSRRLPNAITLVERYLGEDDKKKKEEESKKEPDRSHSLHVNDIKLLEDVSNELGPKDFARAFVRHQDLAEFPPGGKPAAVMREYYASMDLVKRHALRGVEMRGSGNLFNQLTILLDQIVIASFQQTNPEGVRCSINLNVESVFTRGFEAFLGATSSGLFANMLFEFRQANVLQNFDEFSVACDLIRARGGKIVVDAVFPETVWLVNLNRLNIEIAKIFWRQGAENVLPKARDDIRAIQDGGARFALVRVDDQTAIDTGHDLGIHLFQGFYVDRLLSGFDQNGG